MCLKKPFRGKRNFLVKKKKSTYTFNFFSFKQFFKKDSNSLGIGCLKQNQFCSRSQLQLHHRMKGQFIPGSMKGDAGQMKLLALWIVDNRCRCNFFNTKHTFASAPSLSWTERELSEYFCDKRLWRIKYWKEIAKAHPRPESFAGNYLCNF